MSYNTYKLIHLIGIFTLFLGFGVAIGSDKTKARWAAPVHGVALLFILVAGFGMLARLGFHGALPGWAIGKLLIWLILGAAISFAKRKLMPVSILIPLLLVLAGTAGYLALWKP
jgi:hypothetical protein